MTSARPDRDNDAPLKRINHTPVWLGLHVMDGGADAAEIVPLGLSVHRKRLLRALVERFGGEVTASALTRYLSRDPVWTSQVPSPRLTDILRTLQGLGAVELEQNGEHDWIVRILPDGAELYT